MSYDELLARLDRLETSGDRRIVTLPDGSVDRLYVVTGERGERLETTDEFGRQVARDGDSFELDPVETRAGGQAVNAAMQAAALEDDVTLVGHLDHPVLSELPFETRSMGDPATIRVLTFDGEELLLSESGPAEGGWGVEELSVAFDWRRLVAADALCVGNWVSIPGVADVFDRLATTPPDDPVRIVVDPGPIELAEWAAVEAFFETLSEADSAADELTVHLSVNPTEVETALEGFEIAGHGATTDRLADLRSTIGVTSAVVHGPDEAAVATRDRTVSVPMLEVQQPQFATGAGDRFSGALACALAREWPWEHALALANGCAARFVATAEAGSVAEVRAFVRDHNGRR